MQSKNFSGSSPAPSRQPRPTTSTTSAMLTPSELEQLRQNAKTLSERSFEAFKKNPIKGR